MSAPTNDPIRTDRLLLRPWRHDDADRLLDIMSRVEVTQWLGFGEPYIMRDLDEAHARIDRYAERSAHPPLRYWAVEVVETGQVAGSVLLLTLPNAEHGEVEIGWNLHPDCWGKGYATEAATALMAFGFEAGLPEIFAVTDLENAPSQNVCRKLGMRDLGVMERWYDGPSQAFRITAEEWRAR